MIRATILATMMSLCSTALANPIMAGGSLSACQPPASPHVLLRFFCANDSYASCDAGEVTRGESVVGGEWDIDIEPNADLGSGVTGDIHRGTRCDCFVPVGDHEYQMPGEYGAYKVKVMVSDGADTASTCLDKQDPCESVCPKTPPPPVTKDAGVDQGSTPEQDAGAVDDEETDPQEKVEPVDKDESKKDQTADSDGGCSFGATHPELPLVLALFFAIALLRRRRG